MCTLFKHNSAQSAGRFGHLKICRFFAFYLLQVS